MTAFKKSVKFNENLAAIKAGKKIKSIDSNDPIILLLLEILSEIPDDEAFDNENIIDLAVQIITICQDNPKMALDTIVACHSKGIKLLRKLGEV